MTQNLTLAPLILLFASCAGEQSALLPPGPSMEAKLRVALAGPARRDSERTRDPARHPAETLGFFGLRDDATVVELWPGAGYYTAILAPALAERGRLFVTHFDPGGQPRDWQVDEVRWLERLAKDPGAFGKVVKRVISKTNLALGPDGSADFVLTFRNVHNWISDGYAEEVFASAARVLKPGGVLGVEEHRGRPGMTEQQIDETGYVPEEVVIALAEKAGLRLVSRSEVNANPRDTKDHPEGVWSLPPTLAGKEVGRDRFLAIGESDRMTLKFVKP